jgi:carbon starvation protein
MPVAVPFLVAVGLFAIAFASYGRILGRLFGLDPARTTPAVQLQDGADYVPTPRVYLLGQHFSAITAAGPIIGPIVAGIYFGWLPALVWIVIGAIFIGAMHDFSALVGSIRHQARSVAEIVREHMSHRAFLLFMGFVWLALVYIIIAFTDITARAFVDSLSLPDGRAVAGGGVATASILYLGLGLLMGFCLHRLKLPLWLATLIFLPLVGLAIIYGQSHAIVLPAMGGSAVRTWSYLLLAYCGIASVLPVWALLQPRGYLGGFFLYAVLFAALAGILFGGDRVMYPAFLGFQSDRLGPLFPVLFITVACGACSGFHGIVCSGTTSKQLRRETDAHLIGYGGMLLEGVVAVVSLVTVMVLARGSEAAAGDPNLIYARGIGNFLRVFGIDPTFAVAFGLLAFTTFIYDTLDVATRLGRYIFQELAGVRGRRMAWMATLATLLLPALFMSATLHDARGNVVAAWRVFWTIFGSSNQLLAALTLLGLTVWLLRTGRRAAAMLTSLPMAFMMTVTLWSLLRMLGEWVQRLRTGGGFDPVGPTALVLTALAVLLILEAFMTLVGRWRRPAPVLGTSGAAERYD